MSRADFSKILVKMVASEAYQGAIKEMVSQYIDLADETYSGIMAQLAGAPRTAPDWTWNNPCTAVEAFLARNPDFVLEEPGFPFNEGAVRKRVTYWPNSFIKRR